MNSRVVVGASLVLLVSACGGSSKDVGEINPGGNDSVGAGAGAGNASGGQSEAGAGTTAAGGSSAGSANSSAGDESAGAAGEQGNTDPCLNGIRDAEETDVDCGGPSCAPCQAARSCATGADCASLVCQSGACRLPTCSDQVQNQDETDTDCGGTCRDTNPCAVSSSCSVPGDCASYLCTKNKCVADLVVAPEDVIDDFEDDDVVLPLPAEEHGDRAGRWFVFGDDTGTNSLNVVTMRRGKSELALYTTGADFSNWGSGIGVDFNNADGGATKSPYDGSRYSGVTFWARAEEVTTVMVRLTDINTDSSAAGHTCTSCDHAFFRSAALSSAWQRITIPFSNFTLEPGNDPVPTAFAADAMVSLQFMEQASSDSYEIWIDDVAFVR